MELSAVKISAEFFFSLLSFDSRQALCGFTVFKGKRCSFFFKFMFHDPVTQHRKQNKKTSFVWELFCSTVFIRQPKDSCSSLTLQLIDDYILSDCHNHEPFIIGALSNWTLDIYMVGGCLGDNNVCGLFLINGLLFLERAFPFFWGGGGCSLSTTRQEPFTAITLKRRQHLCS